MKLMKQAGYWKLVNINFKWNSTLPRKCAPTHLNLKFILPAALFSQGVLPHVLTNQKTQIRIFYLPFIKSMVQYSSALIFSLSSSHNITYLVKYQGLHLSFKVLFTLEMWCKNNQQWHHLSDNTIWIGKLVHIILTSI